GSKYNGCLSMVGDRAKRSHFRFDSLAATVICAILVTVFRPKLLDCLRGYDCASFFADLGAGATVGLIALPLAIGFGIASGVTPAQGLWTAIIAGFLISALGGSKVQIGGPTGAFVPILAGIVATHGYHGLAIATIMAGLILVLMGVFKLG